MLPNISTSQLMSFSSPYAFFFFFFFFFFLLHMSPYFYIIVYVVFFLVSLYLSFFLFIFLFFFIFFYCFLFCFFLFLFFFLFSTSLLTWTFNVITAFQPFYLPARVHLFFPDFFFLIFLHCYIILYFSYLWPFFIIFFLLYIYFFIFFLYFHSFSFLHIRIIFNLQYDHLSTSQLLSFYFQHFLLFSSLFSI